MKLTPGMRVCFEGIESEFIVVRAPESEASLVCANRLPVNGAGQEGGAGVSTGEQIEVGGRYAAQGVELLCVKQGPGPLVIDGAKAEKCAPKQLPSSD